MKIVGGPAALGVFIFVSDRYCSLHAGFSTSFFLLEMASSRKLIALVPFVPYSSHERIVSLEGNGSVTPDEPIRAPGSSPGSEASEASEPIRGSLDPGSAPGASPPCSGSGLEVSDPTRAGRIPPRLSRRLSGKTDTITVRLTSNQLTKDPVMGYT